jgi:hypothetical protein
MRSLETITTTFLGGILLIAGLTTVFGRSNTPKVFDSLGRAGTGLVRAALGAGTGLNK